MKNKTTVLIIGLLVIVSLVVGIFVWKKITTPVLPPIEEEEVKLPEVDSSVSVSLTPRADNKAVNLSVGGIPKGTESIEYELSYDTSAGLPKGALGKIKLTGSEKAIDREILLGTCSRNVCKYDEGVTKIDLVLRFNTRDGSSQFQKSYDL